VGSVGRLKFWPLVSMVRADTSDGMPDAGRRTVWVAEYTGGGSNVCTRVLQSQLCLKGRRVAKYQGSSSFAGGLMGAGDALGRDAQASSATRRNGVIYQGTEKGNVSERGGRAEELTARREGGGRCQGLIARKGVGLLLARSQSRNPASRLRQWLDCSSAGAHLLQTDGADMPTSCLLACLWSSSPTVLAMQLVMAACESHERLWNISPHTSTTPLHTPTERHGTFAVSSQCKRSDTHSLAATPC
jgi:hypothetical protein